MTRALRLYWLAAMEVLHRLRYEWAREIVVFLASLILFATFLYVFNDFLNVQVSSLSQAMRDRFAEVAAIVVLTAGTAAAAAALRRERLADQSLARSATALGEEPAVVRLFVVLRAASALALIHGLTWLFVLKTMVVPSLGQGAIAEGVMAALSVAVAFLIPPRRKESDSSYTNAHATTRPPLATLVTWRLSQLLRQNRLTRMTLAVAAALVLLLGTVTAGGAPTFACIALGLAIGFVASLSLVFQLAEDLPGAWTERGLGVTHDQFVGAYERLGVIMGVGAGAMAAAAVALGRLIGPLPVNTATWNDVAKILVVTAVPALVFPWIMLQIDGRRPGVGAVLVLIAGLFLGTAVYANWLSLLLPVILRYYALGSQAGRFYRA